ncbi:hypothetical protein BDN71DRAFT_1022637 [Pleurotus eryngii]|uniref:Uncharacterized protein n=1 Tax=Pleurotus eryngii TaxID=5323 RepID=A0A9P5ZTC5_PLEER|nr:hypothetical protein BDN71DRAFT_1022637 [Pleurotus eryngii]
MVPSMHSISKLYLFMTLILTSIFYQFFFFSRKATRSLSISATLAFGNAPERLVSARRAPASDGIAKRGPTLHHTGTIPAADIEAGPTAAPTQARLRSHNVNRDPVEGPIISGGEAIGNVDG